MALDPPARARLRPALRSLRLLTQEPLLSPRTGVRMEVAPRTFAVDRRRTHDVAPGAEEFLPPAATGPWLPPQRTFSSLGGAPISAEASVTYQVGLEQEFGAGDHHRTISYAASGSPPPIRWRPSSGSKSEGARTTTTSRPPATWRSTAGASASAETFAARPWPACDYSLGQAAGCTSRGGSARACGAPAIATAASRIHDLTTAIPGPSRPPRPRCRSSIA